MIDFHCHLDLYDNPAEVITEINARGTYVLAVTTTPHAWAGTRKLVGDSPRIRVALGLHPELVGSATDDLLLFRRLLQKAKYVGEVGLDGSPHLRGTYADQEKRFREILAACSELGGRVLSIHSRRAAAAVTDLLSEYPGAGTPVLHWFSGTTSQLERALSVGCWFSVNPMMLRSSKGRSLVEAMPRDRVLLETDAPFATDEAGPLMPWRTSELIPHFAKLWRVEYRGAQIELKNNLAKLATQGFARTRNQSTFGVRA